MATSHVDGTAAAPGEGGAAAKGAAPKGAAPKGAASKGEAAREGEGAREGEAAAYPCAHSGRVMRVLRGGWTPR